METVVDLLQPAETGSKDKAAVMVITANLLTRSSTLRVTLHKLVVAMIARYVLTFQEPLNYN
jgi:hypothetical protein